MVIRLALSLAIASAWPLASLSAADLYRLPEGTVTLQSAGPLAFGDDGLLLIGDPKAAAVIAIQTGDKSGAASAAQYQVTDLAAALAKGLGKPDAKIEIVDLAANPLSGNLYFSVKTPQPQIVRLNADGTVAPVSLEKVPFSRTVLANAPEDKVTGEGPRARNNRDNSITDLAWVGGQVIVAGMTNAAAPSTVRALGFPFTESNAGANLEIYHAAHGRSEDNAVVRTLVPFIINGEPTVLAGFVCTPLVKFPVAELTGGEKIKGTTIAELGNRNAPLDLITYQKDGANYLLLANSVRGVMKISTADIDRKDGLTKPVTGGGTAGQAFESIDALSGTVQLDRLNATHAVVVQKGTTGELTLKSVPLP